jgi:hypothetical protein
LQVPSEELDDTGELRESDYPIGWKVRDVINAVKR